MRFGIYHAGVEWGFSPGPTDCTGASTNAGSMDDFMQQLQNMKVVHCDEPALRVLGLTLAIGTVIAVISAAMAVVAAIGARAKA